MARIESANEDFMAEAVSLIRRIEFRLPNRSDPIVVGFNQLEWLFVYVGSDPMYRFDEQGRLRRAYVDGILYRTSGTTLTALRRQHHKDSHEAGVPAESRLLRRDLTSEELDSFQQRMRRAIQELTVELTTASITRQHPLEMDDLAKQIHEGFVRVLTSREFIAPAIVKRGGF